MRQSTTDPTPADENNERDTWMRVLVVILTNTQSLLGQLPAERPSDVQAGKGFHLEITCKSIAQVHFLARSVCRSPVPDECGRSCVSKTKERTERHEVWVLHSSVARPLRAGYTAPSLSLVLSGLLLLGGLCARCRKVRDTVAEPSTVDFGVVLVFSLVSVLNMLRRQVRLDGGEGGEKDSRAWDRARASRTCAS